MPVPAAALEWRTPARPSNEHLTDADLILNALPAPLFIIDGQDRLHRINVAAETFLGASTSSLAGRSLSELLAPDSPLVGLAQQVRRTGAGASEHDVTLAGPRLPSCTVSIDVVPLAERPEWLMIVVHVRTIVDKIDRQLTHRGAARSVAAMAQIMAHELKNPLSGIRGAAQLLGRNAAPNDAELATLICDETDRIVTLIDGMEMFSDDRPIPRRAVNIHRVLEHVRRLAASGFAAGRRFVEVYDPSLPPVFGNRDLLVQLFLNLVKNAAEATRAGEGVIALRTRYQHGVRLKATVGVDRMHLPLVVTVEDNGSGIPPHLQPQLFDPFVTSKAGGKGLGLALAAKIVSDHGGTIEFTSAPRHTIFSVMLPAAADDEDEP